jgi:hypothetical protein
MCTNFTFDDYGTELFVGDRVTDEQGRTGTIQYDNEGFLIVPDGEFLEGQIKYIEHD